MRQWADIASHIWHLLCEHVRAQQAANGFAKHTQTDSQTKQTKCESSLPSSHFGVATAESVPQTVAQDLFQLHSKAAFNPPPKQAWQWLCPGLQPSSGASKLLLLRQPTSTMHVAEIGCAQQLNNLTRQLTARSRAGELEQCMCITLWPCSLTKPNCAKSTSLFVLDCRGRSTSRWGNTPGRVSARSRAWRSRCPGRHGSALCPGATALKGPQ